MTWEQHPDLKGVDALDCEGGYSHQAPLGGCNSQKGAQAAGDDERLVPPPTQPMLVAREIISMLYTHSSDVILRNHRGDFYWWGGRRWSPLETRDLRARVYEFLEHARYIHPKTGLTPFAPTRRKVDDVVDALRAVARIDSADNPPCWLDRRLEPPGSELTAMANGLLHVPTRTLHPHSAQFFNHHALPFAFEADAAPPKRWLSFLRDLWGNDSASIRTLQEIMGYLLAGDKRQQKIFLIVGPKRGGKGTIGRVLTGLLGVQHVAAPTLASLATHFGLSPLIGKPLALVSDARLAAHADSKTVVERLLAVSGEDSVTFDRKYKELWTGCLPTRFLIMSNELPRLPDASGALASRFITLILEKSFYGRENPALTQELLREAPAILNWALDGLDRLTDRGFFVNPESGSDAIQQMEDLSSPISAFVREECIVGAGYEQDIAALWSAWKARCTDDNRHPGTKAVFGRDLRAAVPALKKRRPRTADGERHHVYQGLRLVRITAWDQSDHGDQELIGLEVGHGGHSAQPEYAQENAGGVCCAGGPLEPRCKLCPESRTYFRGTTS